MIDSGASGMGFVDPAFVQQCGVALRPSSQRITLADGSEVRAAGLATLTYSLATRSCKGKEDTLPVQFTSTFVVTPLAPHQLILGVGWLEHHRALVGFGERSIQLQVNGVGHTHCIRPLARCNDDGSPAAHAVPLQLKTISAKRVCKLKRQGKIEQLFAVLIKPKTADGTTDTVVVPLDEADGTLPLGMEDPAVRALFEEFRGSVFGEPKPGVPRKRGVEHAIQLLPGALPPPARPLRHQSAKDAAVMKEYVEAGLKSGVLSQSVSPYGSMALIVMKKDGTPRVVIDYRALNEVTVKNKYPLPLMDELFDRTQGAQYFTSIDLRNGFHQIAIRPEDREKTAFRTRFGHFEYTVLPMGLCNAPGTFMQLMNQTFADMLDKSVLCFLDDILVFSKTREEHLQHLRTVLTRLRDQELYVKPSKCAFMQREVGFLGHRIGADGLRVAPDKISAVQQWPVPKSVTEVRSFLGLANFYRRFVRDYSRIALPLTELTKDTVAWSWGPEQQKAFEALKAALCSPPVLMVPDQTKPFVLNCDACKYAIGATLQQDHGNGLQPIAFFSAKMSDAERNYDVREQEFMALFKACQYWRHYLHGTQPFTLLTDHDSLKYHKSMPNLSGRLARWIEKMAEFDYKLSHIPGKDNVVADALSRRADLAAVSTSNRFAVLAAVTPRVREPESQEQRQRNIDAATKVLPPQPDLPAPDRNGTIKTPTQRCSANTKVGTQCGQRTAVAHLCWNHLARDMGVRVRRSGIPQAGRGLFAAWPEGLPKDHRIPYTGDEIVLDDDFQGGAYVLETKRGEGIDAARRNSGPGRWINDPRGARNQRGRALQPNCTFVVHTLPGGGDRVAAVRTLRPVLRGEELLVRYGPHYWRYQAPAKKAAAAKRAAARKRPRKQRDVAAVHQLIAATVQAASVDGASAQRALRQTAGRQAAAAAARAQQERGSARAGRDAPATTPSATELARPSQPQIPATDAEAAGAREALVSAILRAASADAAYQQDLQTLPPGWRANGGLLFNEKGQLRVPEDDSLRTRILAELHDSATGAHAGRDRMLAAAQQRFEWRGMASDVERYATTCDACQRNKHSKQLRPGLLMPLPLPEEPCMHWTTDAVTGLPRTRHGFDAIQVYVDRLTKLKRLAATRTTDGSVQLAGTTLRTIIGPHGMPKSMVSDRDTRMTARFWRELSRVLGSEVTLSTAYHAPTDGQSEREIQTVITALRSYVNAQGNDWDEYLPALELALNSKQQASTGAAPFTLVYGTEARLPIDCALDDVRPASLPAVAQRAERMKAALDHSRTQAERAQAKQKRLADRHRRLLLLKEGDQVLLSTEHLQLRSGTHKLT
ncbi:reverse transcriptase domain-containing protein, partial [Aquabacterium sp.]|uniref:reverse transcriptase domain-containing protein n=1 Tax=Aquabacterium sp. TaxID=1872578 RepID=UPI0026329737